MSGPVTSAISIFFGILQIAAVLFIIIVYKCLVSALIDIQKRKSEIGRTDSAGQEGSALTKIFIATFSNVLC